jgi:hypothetical protein
MPPSSTISQLDIVQYPVAAPFSTEREEIPLRVRETASFSASARKQCIFGLSESRFLISA